MLRTWTILAVFLLSFMDWVSPEELSQNVGGELQFRHEDDEDDEVASNEVFTSREDLEQLVADGRKKVKIKKKHKKFLLEMLMAGLLLKSGLLPIGVAFLKLLTGKALMITLMALTLITAITFKSAAEDKGTKTEIINLVPHKHKRSLKEEWPRFMDNLERHPK